MPSRPRRPSLVGLVCGGPAPAASEAAPAVPWTSFRFEAERLGSRVTVEVRVDPEPAAPLPAGLWPSVRGEPLRPSGPTVLKLTVLATIDPIGIAPIRMEGRVWFDPATGTPLRTIRSREGSDDYAQWFVFGREGVFRRQHEPLDRAPGGRAARALDARERERLRRPGRRRPLPVAGRDLDAGLPHVELGRAGQSSSSTRCASSTSASFTSCASGRSGGRRSPSTTWSDAARAAERRAGSTGARDHPVERHADRLIPRRAWNLFSRTPSSPSARTAACRWRAPASFPSSAGWICA